ncbi:hypothetical protein SmJEL517_g03701 [Synchytrium microbalum]|uniref:Mitochondrial carrier domain-containing protein n=1 Tax=Synchytrium microbalum TaxID=1806994 RepID=A0A507C5W8_9FUNG|nr:uncharacterized protein SmJEL517_g03701 [Synchytrium microbalum]TPX33366.1 hypothetical protein SmJEL517_g03701 [Synchytrium microbalum]
MADSVKDFIAGTFGGWAQVFAGHPFDTLKVRLQTQGDPPKYRNAMDCLSKSIKEEGFQALYKGATSPLLGVGVANAVLFTVHGFNLRTLGGGQSSDEMSIAQHFGAGALSGIAIAFVNCPVDLLKIRLQTQYTVKKRLKDGVAPPTTASGIIDKPRYTGVFDAATKITKADGIRGLYRGLGICIVREIPSFAGYFGIYELSKRLLAGSNPQEPLAAWQLLLAGGFAGIAAWLPCYPQDVLKSRIQSDTRNAPIMEYVREIIKSGKGSYRGFFRGFGPTMVRAFPANAATFLTYELAIKAMQGTEPQKGAPRAALTAF